MEGEGNKETRQPHINEMMAYLRRLSALFLVVRGCTAQDLHDVRITPDIWEGLDRGISGIVRDVLRPVGG